jgi:hypothetical protein
VSNQCCAKPAQASASGIASGERTKKAVVAQALREYIARREQRRVVELMGKLEWDASFDYKAERSRK